MKSRRARFAFIAPLACAATLAILAGCSSGSGPDAPKTVVYVAGSYSDGSYAFPCYWRDGTRVALPYGANVGGGASAIFASGGTIYTAGSTNDGHATDPCCWTGTIRSDFSGEGAEGISVAGGTVYTVVNGEWIDGTTTAYGGAYYEGATFNRLKGIENPGNLDRPERDTYAFDIAVAGGTVYTAGQASNGEAWNACYWTGADDRTDLDASAEAYAICVSGGTVYTAGRYYGGADPAPCYWTGATRTDLPIVEGNEECYAEDIAVDDGTVYTAGYYGTFSFDTFTYSYTACYWIGDERHDLPGEGTYNNQAYGICVLEGSVYVSGYYNDGEKDVPCYWKDGVRVDLPGGIDGCANDIVVVKE
jgi:hypothetical protein